MALIVLSNAKTANLQQCQSNGWFDVHLEQPQEPSESWEEMARKLGGEQRVRKRWSREKQTKRSISKRAQHPGIRQEESLSRDEEDGDDLSSGATGWWSWENIPALPGTASGTAELRPTGSYSEPVMSLMQSLVRTSALENAIKAAQKIPERADLYDNDDWARHKDGARYMRHFQSLPYSSTAKFALRCSCVNGAWAMLLSLYEHMGATGAHVGNMPLQMLPDVGVEPFTLTGTALSLLLVFRTDAAYARWDSGRRQFGDLITRSRNLVRKAVTHFNSDREVVDLVRYCVSFAVCTRLQLEQAPIRELEAQLRGWLDSEEVGKIREARHRPQFCLLVLSEIIGRATLRHGVESGTRLAMDTDVEALEQMLGSSERVFRTPIPGSYSRHTSRCLLIWLGALPVGIVKELGPLAPIVAFVVTFFYIGVDQIGVAIENPFQNLPLKLLTNKVKFNALEMVTKRDDARRLVHKRHSETVP